MVGESDGVSYDTPVLRIGGLRISGLVCVKSTVGLEYHITRYRYTEPGGAFPQPLF